MVCGITVGDALASLDREHPGIAAEVLTGDGQVRQSVELFLGGTNIQALQGLETLIGVEELLAIVPAIPAAKGP